MDKTLIVDNVKYDKLHVTNLQRDFEILDGENAGRVKTGKMIRDIIGTYYNYTLAIEPDDTEESMTQYDALYQVLSNTEDGHYIRVPYGQETLTFYAYVTKGTDTLKSVTDDLSKWEGLEVKFIAISPQRTPV